MPNIEILFGLDKRHSDVERVIHNYASRHRATDGAIGGASNLIPLPFASNATMLALLWAQTRLVYRPLSKEIASIYVAANPDNYQRSFDEVDKDEKQAFNGFQNNLYTFEFLLENAKDITSEFVAGSLVAAIPYVGFAASVAMDAMIAATMTWRVGLMTATYYCNESSWLGSRKETFELSKKFVGALSIKSKERINIGGILQQNQSIVKKHLNTFLREFIKPLVTLGRTDDEYVKRL